MTAQVDPETRQVFRETVRRFVANEVEPHIEAWEEAHCFPRELYARAGELGILAVGFDPKYGGLPGTSQMIVELCEELASTGSGGLIAGLLSHAIGAPPIEALGSEDLKTTVLTEILAGERISALAVTEPGGGSDVANLTTIARREGDHYIVNGSKIFITSGMRADYITTAVRTGGPGMEGISLLVIPGEASGLTRTPLKKMGWWCSDTAALYFDDCRVPAKFLLGQEGMGFLGLMHNFNRERLFIAAMAYAFSNVCLQQSVEYARVRTTFGRPLIKRQVLRHKLVDMASRIAPLRSFLREIGERIDAGEHPVADVCMLKNVATQCLEFCAKEAVQIFGGAGYMRGTKVERIYRETKVLSIGGGAEEVMKELAARQLGW
ncbi:MAG: acyl-CoA dehydrogenase family protein [Nannocystaceae bacterium]